MDNIKKFEDFLDKMQGLLDNAKKQGHIIVRVDDLENTFPELKESDDERIRKALIEMVHDFTGDSLWVDYNIHKEEALTWLEKQGETFTKKDVDDAYIEGMAFAKNELEKQAEQEETLCDKCKKAQPSHSCQDITALGRCAIEKQDEQNPTDKEEPKFKVKYAGSEYNVLEIKEIAGDAYYGIEDEPNHIDYVLPDNCEIVSEQKPTQSEDETSIAIKDSKAYRIGFADGEAYAKEEMQSSCGEKDEQSPKWKGIEDLKAAILAAHPTFKQKPSWSEEDETGWTNTMIMIKEVASKHYTKDSIKLVIDWLDSIKERIKGKL